MKKNAIKNAWLGIISWLLLLTSGCRKDNKPEPGSSKPECRIITISSESVIYNLTYNNDGKLLSLNDNNNYTTTYTYNDNTIITTTNQKGTDYYQQSIITLNDFGLAKQVKTALDGTGLNWIKTVNEYNKDQLIKTTISTSSGTQTVQAYRWENGNPTAVITLTPGKSDTADIEYYTDKPYQQGGFLYISQLIAGYATVRPKNLLKSERTGSGIVNCSYGFDHEGRIRSATVVQDTTIRHFNYQYQCE